MAQAIFTNLSGGVLMKKYAQKRTVRVQKMGKWGFVPKVWVALLATLISISLFVSCENTAGGGSSKSSAGGRDAVDTLKSYTFKYNGMTVGTALVANEVSFAKIKEDAGSNLKTVENIPDFLGWKIDGTDDTVNDSDLFSESTTFVAKYKEGASLPSLAKYNFFVNGIRIGCDVWKQGSVDFKTLIAEAKLSEKDYKSDLFDGWKVRDSDGNATGVIIANDADFSTSTDFMAVYRVPPKYKEKVTEVDFKKNVWYSEQYDEYMMFVYADGEYEVLIMKKGVKYEAAKQIAKAYLALTEEDPNHPGQFKSDEQDPDGNYIWKDKYIKRGASLAKTTAYDDALRNARTDFTSAIWFPGFFEDHIMCWIPAAKKDVDIDPEYYVSLDGEKLLDADGNVLMRAVF